MNDQPSNPIDLDAYLAEPVAAQLDALHQELPALITTIHTVRADAEQRIYTDWKPALDLFDVIVNTTLQAMGRLNTLHGPQRAQDGDTLYGVILRLLGRACLTASEIAALLRTGHAQAAYARWRTLHELEIVSALLFQQNSQELAQRYENHQWIESDRAAKEYQASCSLFGQEPLSTKVMERLAQQRDALIQQYGAEFKTAYGWAALVVSSPNIASIERAVGMQEYRPFYRAASHGVHPNMLGLEPPSSLDERIFVAGPHNTGFTTPALASLGSLWTCAQSLFLLVQDEQAWTDLIVLRTLIEEATTAFHACDQRLDGGVVWAQAAEHVSSLRPSDPRTS